MLRIADQKAGLIGLKFFVDTHGWLEGAIGENSKFFINIFFSFFPRATPGPSAGIR